MDLTETILYRKNSYEGNQCFGPGDRLQIRKVIDGEMSTIYDETVPEGFHWNITVKIDSREKTAEEHDA